MAFQVSPGVNVSEIDLTAVVPAVSVSVGAMAGVFRWGPVNERVLVSSEKQLVNTFGEPASYFLDSQYTNLWNNYETFYTAANFLSYSNALYVVRTVGQTAAAASSTNFDAKYIGALGNSIGVSYCSNGAFSAVASGYNIAINPFETTGVVSGLNPAYVADATSNADLVFNGSTITTTTTDLSGFEAGETITIVNTTTNDGTFTVVGTPTATSLTVSETFTNQTATAGRITGQIGGASYVDAGDDIILENGIRLTVTGVGSPVFDVAGGVTRTVLPTDSTVAPVADGSVNADLTFTGNTLTTTTTDLSVFRDGEEITISGTGTGNDGQTYVVDGTPTETSLTITATFAADVGPNAGVVTGEFGAVNLAADTITFTSHGFITGDIVQYSDNGGTSIEGLENGGVYWVIKVGDNTFQLASSAADATDGTQVDLQGYGLGLDHTFTKVSAYAQTLTFASRYSDVDAYADSFSVQWRDSGLFLSEPEADHVHVVVRDVDGEITGTAGTILEVYENLSTVPGATRLDGSTKAIVDVLENQSNYISTTTAKAAALVLSSVSEQQVLTGGDDGEDEDSIAIGDVAKGYDLYKDAAEVDISLVLQGKARGGAVLANYITNNICDSRKDCVSFVSPEVTDVTAQDVVDFASGLTGSTYMVVDTGYKYQYDKYNDVYRWIPLNGDIAGLCARTDDERDPWFSPAGYNRGIIKNVVKLRFNPNKADRDLLYINGINPVITEPGSGTLLFGDKTFSPIASAFDRINVRRLFIVLEKAIANASKALLFEFNDEFTRAQFKNLVEPFLREVQGRRGIYDFKVVCDETNNTAQVIDSNQFVGDIFIKPARSINFIQLNFVAVRSGVEFEEVVGAV